MKINKILIGLFLSTFVNASDDVLDIDLLLNDIEKKTDLSEKTKLENSGISLIYTRDDLKRMQVKYLKDILKSGAMFGYSENRYGLPDPLTHGDNQPFMSSSIRIFIDNQEISGGMYGSGLILYGNLDIDFVDHIEIYSQSPTYEYSTEPTVMLIKLYSKTALKDTGSKLKFTFSSYNSLKLDGYTSNEIDKDWSYFAYVSRDKLNRKEHTLYQTKLLRDREVTHIFGTIKNKNSSFMLDAISSKGDGFIGISMDATPTFTQLSSDSLHIGYDGFLDNFSFLMSYDYLETSNSFRDEKTENPDIPYMRDVDSQSNIITAELKYKKNSEHNSFIMGAKHRFKKYKYTKLIVNDNASIPKKTDTQSVKTLFMENHYSIKENLILTTALQYVRVDNKNAIYNKNSNLFMYRYSLTYLKDKWIFKLLGGHTESFLEPYLVDSQTLLVDGDLKSKTSDTIYENIVYKNSNFKYEFTLGYQNNNNYLLPDSSFAGKLNNYKKDVEVITAIARVEYKYNKYDKLFLESSYIRVGVLPNIGYYEVFKNIIRNINSYKKFDIFNELIYDRNSVHKKDYFDYSAGVQYNCTKDFTLSIKGENILNKGNKVDYIRINTATFSREENLNISPFDRKFSISMEYLF